MRSTARRTILLVEADASLRRVIALGLQSRDLRVVEFASISQVSDLNAQQAGMMVVDIDGEVGNSHELLTEIESHSHLSLLPVILLAWDTSLTPDGLSNDVNDRVIRLAKPFDARALSNAIESLLATGERLSRLAVQRVELRATPSAPSICPMITAAGLMLALIGLMLQLAVTAVGLLIVVVALLCWSLGPRSQPKESMLLQG